MEAMLKNQALEVSEVVLRQPLLLVRRLGLQMRQVLLELGPDVAYLG